MDLPLQFGHLIPTLTGYATGNTHAIEAVVAERTRLNTSNALELILSAVGRREHFSFCWRLSSSSTPFCTSLGRPMCETKIALHLASITLLDCRKSGGNARIISDTTTIVWTMCHGMHNSLFQKNIGI